MHKKAIILDMDNTLYSVHSTDEVLFAPLFELIRQDGNHTGDMDDIWEAVMRSPFQKVAKEYHFSEELFDKSMALLKDLTYEGEIEPFEDYRLVKDLPLDKFLVTTGFKKLQQSKVDSMKLAEDFQEIHIVDPATTNRTKKDVFEDIIKRHGYDKSEVLVVGDDPQSEIKAADDAGIEAVLYDKHNQHNDTTSHPVISDFGQLKLYLG